MNEGNPREAACETVKPRSSARQKAVPIKTGFYKAVMDGIAGNSWFDKKRNAGLKVVYIIINTRHEQTNHLRTPNRKRDKSS